MRRTQVETSLLNKTQKRHSLIQIYLRKSWNPFCYLTTQQKCLTHRILKYVLNIFEAVQHSTFSKDIVQEKTFFDPGSCFSHFNQPVHELCDACFFCWPWFAFLECECFNFPCGSNRIRYYSFRKDLVQRPPLNYLSYQLRTCYVAKKILTKKWKHSSNWFNMRFKMFTVTWPWQ